MEFAPENDGLIEDYTVTGEKGRYLYPLTEKGRAFFEAYQTLAQTKQAIAKGEYLFPETPEAKTQEEKVKEAVKGEPKTIKEVAEETKILEPNVRRILGQGTKKGVFTRVDRGVYTLNVDGKDLAYIEPGNALEVLPRLVKEGFKADMVFLDIPYKTAATRRKSRNTI